MLIIIRTILSSKTSKIVSIIDTEWMCSAPPFDDLATFHIFLKLQNKGHEISHFYNGYQQIKTIPTHYFQHLDEYILYRLMSMVSYQLELNHMQLESFFKTALLELKNHLKKMMKT
jgi:hypothetical protein